MESRHRSLFLPTNSEYSALTLLTRLAQRRPDCADWVGKALLGRLEILSEIALDVAIETGDLMGLKLAEELKNHGSAEVVARVQDLCDSDPYLLAVSLRDVARVSTEGRLAALRQRRDSLDVEEKFDYAISANNLGLRLWYLDASNAGLRAVEEAVDVCRELSEVDPDRFLPEFARALNSFSTLLAATGRTEEAVAALQESLEILRNFTGSNQDEFLPDLAMALNNMGNRLNTLSRHEETLLVMQEAVEIFRKVSLQKPGPLLSFFATALANLGNALSQTGRFQEALQVTQEAVDMRRLLVEYSPDAFLPDLASGLHNLARRLGSLGLQENALKAAREAFEIRKQLIKRRPETFLTGFIRSVNALGRRLQEAGNVDEALEIVREGGRILAPFLVQEMRLGGRLASAVESYRELYASLGEPDNPNASEAPPRETVPGEMVQSETVRMETPAQAQAGEVPRRDLLNDLLNVLPVLPEVFEKRDIYQALGYVPPRATLYRAIGILSREKQIAIAQYSQGGKRTQYRKVAVEDAQQQQK